MHRVTVTATVTSSSLAGHRHGEARRVGCPCLGLQGRYNHGRGGAHALGKPKSSSLLSWHSGVSRDQPCVCHRASRYVPAAGLSRSPKCHGDTVRLFSRQSICRVSMKFFDLPPRDHRCRARKADGISPSNSALRAIPHGAAACDLTFVRQHRCLASPCNSGIRNALHARSEGVAQRDS